MLKSTLAVLSVVTVASPAFAELSDERQVLNAVSNAGGFAGQGDWDQLAAQFQPDSAVLASPPSAERLPSAITCYQDGANAKDIDAYMACFTEDAVMVDVGRTFTGQEAIRVWASREVIPGGDTFRHRAILEQSGGYAKTEVNWLSWVVHYSYWWDADGKITKMSLQYAG